MDDLNRGGEVMREMEQQEDVLLAEQEQVRLEGHAPAPPPAPGYSRAELEGQLTMVRSLLEEGEFGASEHALDGIIDRLQSWPSLSVSIPVTVADFVPPVTEHHRHQRAALAAALVRSGMRVPDAAALDELIVAVEAGF